MYTIFKQAAATLVITLGFLSSAHTAPVSGQGTWETTLQGRDLDGNAATFEAYYDTVLDITWAADANINGADTWQNQKDWVAALDISGVTGWRLPTNTPVSGVSYNATFSNNGTTDDATATTTTDGTDGGWRDGLGNPVSEMGHMFYVTLGNLGVCEPNGGGSTTSCNTQSGSGLSNTADFLNVQSNNYWSGSEFSSSHAWRFLTLNGHQRNLSKIGRGSNLFAWAVHSGDVSAVPVPGAVWLFGSGLIGLVGLARRRKR